MSTLAKRNINKKVPKKAMSVIIGYVLLIVFAAVIAVIVYNWQKTYVPQDEYASCPEGASIFIINKTYDCESNTLTFFIRNTGKFALGGYFIYVKDNPDKQIATIDISRNNTGQPDPRLHEFGINGVKLGIGENGEFFVTNNYFLPRDEEKETYTLEGIDNIYSIEIVPIRWQEEKGKQVIASCKESRTSEVIKGCSLECEPENENLFCTGRECGTVLNNCYKEITCGPQCPEGEFCTVNGECVEMQGCLETCSNLGYDCGQHLVCGRMVNCGGCPPIAHGYSECNYETGGCSITGCDYGWRDCDGIYYNGCEVNLLLDKNNCKECGLACFMYESCQNGICTPGSTCDGVWNLGEESPDVECDGTPMDERCYNCVCDRYYIPDDLGGCTLDEASVDSCLAWCYISGYDGDNSYCTNSEGHCQSDPLRIHLEQGDSWCAQRDPNAKSCCCVPEGYVFT